MTAATALQLAPTAIIVDDSKIGRFFARNALANAGWAILGEGGSGPEAIRLYAAYQPDMLLLDVVLPELDGLAAARAILAAYPTANVVLCSAFAGHEQVLAARALGVSNFLVKPLAVDRLVEVARSVLGTRATR